MLSGINKTEIYNANDIDEVMPMYNLIKYSKNYSKTSGSLWQYHRDEPALNNAGTPANVTNNTESAENDSSKAVKIIVPLKYLSSFWRTLNHEINLILTSSPNCVVSNAAAYQATTFALTDTKSYVPVVTLSTEDKARVLQQLKSGFKRTVNWNKYHSKKTPQNALNLYFDY